MKPLKSTGVLLVILASALMAMAQDKPCKAKWAELPEIPELSGFRLGMTSDQVKKRVPQLKLGHTDPFGVSKTSISPDFDSRIDKTNFADVRTVSLEFLDGTLFSIWVGFNNSFKWKSAEESIQGVSHELSVPAEWTTKGRSRELTCTDFQLSVSMIAGAPALKIVDITAEATVEQRRQEKADEADATASPSGPSPVIGDTSNKVFYPADTSSLKSVPEKNRISFPNSAEAEKAGYKHSASCL